MVLAAEINTVGNEKRQFGSFIYRDELIPDTGILLLGIIFVKVFLKNNISVTFKDTKAILINLFENDITLTKCLIPNQLGL